MLFLYKMLKFIDKFVNRHRYVEVVVDFFIYSALLIYFWRNSINNYIGFVILLAGFIFWIKSLGDIGSSFQASPKAKKLVTTGMYSRFRHPIYYSGILGDIGLIIYSLNWIILILVVIAFSIQMIRIRKEERVLAQKFGKKYLDYKKQTWL